MQSILFIILMFVIAPGLIYSFLHKPETVEEKRKLFLKTVWVVQATGIVPLFLFAIYGGAQNAQSFWFYKSVNDTLISSGKGLYEALALGYSYFIFYVSIFYGPLVLIEKRLGRKIDRVAYAISIIWFWVTINTLQNFLTNLPGIARQMFPLSDDSISQWALLGYIILTTSTSWLVLKLKDDFVKAFSSKSNKELKSS